MTTVALILVSVFGLLGWYRASYWKNLYEIRVWCDWAEGKDFSHVHWGRKE